VGFEPAEKAQNEATWIRRTEKISLTILRELPKTWRELSNSPSVREYIKSKRTLAKYLKRLKQKGTIKRITDERNRSVYIATDAINLRYVRERKSMSSLAPLARKHRQGYDFEYLHWGGQELSFAKWWNQVLQRRKSLTRTWSMQ
jgi:hypothetical protein